jgi:class 3 adenylate cyclase
MVTIEANSRETFEKIAAFSRRDDFNIRELFPVELTQEQQATLEELRLRLISAELPVALVDALVDHVRRGHESELDRMRARVLARAWGFPVEEVLLALLRATHIGLLLTRWDVVCPHCRGVRSAAKHLGDVPARGRCDVCEIDFSTSKAVSLEVTFRPHPSIRAIDEQIYCTAEPHKKKHIKLQIELQPGQTRSVPSRLRAGRYRMRTKGKFDFNTLYVEPAASLAEIPWSANDEGALVRAGIAPTLTLSNNSSHSKTFVLEEHEIDRDALRPADLFNFQEFRDLFSEEAVAADLKLDIGVQTIMFTDVVGSTRFYLDHGDSEAFAEIRRHFVKAHEIISAHHGALVKTIGDAVMAAFSTPARGVAAAIALQEYFRADNPATKLRIRVSLNSGPCFAVNLNSNIDYFGSTINLGAKLQAVAGAGQVAIMGAMFEQAPVRELVERSGYAVSTEVFTPAGYHKQFTVYRVDV